MFVTHERFGSFSIFWLDWLVVRYTLYTPSIVWWRLLTCSFVFVNYSYMKLLFIAFSYWAETSGRHVPNSTSEFKKFYLGFPCICRCRYVAITFCSSNVVTNSFFFVSRNSPTLVPSPMSGSRTLWPQRWPFSRLRGRTEGHHLSSLSSTL